MQSIISAVGSALTSDPKTKQLDGYKVDDAAKGNTITTNFGVKVVNQEETLKGGNRGPDLLEDFIYREKIGHFDHERIPERVVHARGVAAHGYFQVYESQKDVTKAAFLNDPSLKTPVFLRFSTVLGSRGSADTVRDVRGFAVRFYTQEGNWDMVGNHIPVFFIQDAMKFPDVIHAGKPEPHNEIPQGATAHDNFWDWISLQSESAHMMMWIMSDRTIPRSLRMIQGFGVHSFVLINEQGQRRFVKFHWRPVLGIHSLVWDESQKIAGQDPDFHRRDLTEAIESGNYPEWELGLQIVEEKDEHSFDFDILDATKLIPEELVPIKYVGKMTLNRNVDDYFAETEQVAFCTQHFVPGIQGSNDPLLQGRHFSYQDTQLTRLGGPNFQEIPINRPVCPVFNHQRDGFNRQKIATSKVNYHPNRFGFPKQATEAEGGFLDYAAALAGVKERSLGPKFKEHYNQATLFYNSLAQVEKEHLTDSFIFELGHVNDKAIQERVVDRLNHIEPTVAKKVAYALGLAEPAPIPGWTNHGKSSPALSQVSGPNVIKGSIKTRKIAVLIAEGFDAEQFTAVQGAITKAGGIVQVVAPRKAAIKSSTGTTVEAHWSFAACKSTLFDAVFVVGGAESVRVLSLNGSALAFVTESFKHLKAVGAVKEGIDLLRLCHLVGASFASKNGEVLTSVGVVTGDSAVGPAGVAEAFVQAVGQHRAFERVVAAVPA